MGPFFFGYLQIAGCIGMELEYIQTSSHFSHRIQCSEQSIRMNTEKKKGGMDQNAPEVTTTNLAIQVILYILHFLLPRGTVKYGPW